MSTPKFARTYNQNHVPRKYDPDRRRVSIYLSWSYPAEAGRDPSSLDNRFSTMTEVRRVLWPTYEAPEWSDPRQFQQGIAGSLELFFWAFAPFQEFVGEVTGNVVPVFQRIDQAGFKLPLDERVLADTDTLLVFGLDHAITEQQATREEIEALQSFLKREGTCLILGPHHEVGVSEDSKVRDVEYQHHGDALVPRQQRFGQYTRSVMSGLGIPVENRYGLRPKRDPQTKKLAPLSIAQDLDTRGWLKEVTTFNFHMHLPHYAVTTDDSRAVHVLAKQPIDTSKPHPFTDAGNTEFNMFLWMPPDGNRAGDVLFADSTIFSTLFGADESLRNFWRNIATAN
ncbi:MAG TPA: hypothetical protein VGN90_15370 [Pyrinomonadaceae bacterium]|jgi:hypothetical protein|nr:hypothetical protein [Pyrinomonadaceae bacterium]